MMEQIGGTAGLVWSALNKEDRVALSSIPKIIQQKDSLTYLAIGWLAREGKVEFEISGKKTFVRLAGSERFVSA